MPATGAVVNKKWLLTIAPKLGKNAPQYSGLIPQTALESINKPQLAGSSYFSHKIERWC